MGWALLAKRTAFQPVIAVPGSSQKHGTRSEDFLQKVSPLGRIPAIEEPDTGFVLAESSAILTYLSDANGWSDLYPTELRQRAKVNAYLSWHHTASGTRACTSLFARVVRPDLEVADGAEER